MSRFQAYALNGALPGGVFGVVVGLFCWILSMALPVPDLVLALGGGSVLTVTAGVVVLRNMGVHDEEAASQPDMFAE